MKTHCKWGHALTPDNVKTQYKGRKAYQRCITCARSHALKDKTGYTPIEEIKSAPANRLLRGLRHFDWVGVDELLIAIDAPEQNCTERNTLLATITRLVDMGCIDRRKLNSKKVRSLGYSEVRITQAGRDRLSSALNKYTTWIASAEHDDADEECAA